MHDTRDEVETKHDLKNSSSASLIIDNNQSELAISLLGLD